MDLRQEIEDKLKQLAGHASAQGIAAAVRHIAVAENRLARGRLDREEDYFNDVVYRTNQAFEGILKEAYRVLTGRDISGLTPAEIENHLTEEKIFPARVSQLFKNYRQEWRNKSTHDHTLFFKEQEALLAIVSVSAFFTILLDQIIQVVSKEREHAEVAERKNTLQTEYRKRGTGSLREDVVTLMRLFGEEMPNLKEEAERPTEAVVLGRLRGFIEAVAPDIQAVNVGGNSAIEPDLVLVRSDEQVAIEVELGKPNRTALDSKRLQLLRHLTALKIEDGVIFLSPRVRRQMHINTEHFQLGSTTHNIHVVSPVPTAEERQRRVAY